MDTEPNTAKGYPMYSVMQAYRIQLAWCVSLIGVPLFLFVCQMFGAPFFVKDDVPLDLLTTLVGCLALVTSILCGSIIGVGSMRELLPEHWDVVERNRVALLASFFFGGVIMYLMSTSFQGGERVTYMDSPFLMGALFSLPLATILVHTSFRMRYREKPQDAHHS